MLTFTFLTHAIHGRTPAQVRANNDIVTVPEGKNEISITVPDTGMLTLDFFSKTEQDTVVDQQGNIVADTEFRIETIWCDGIRLESWFNNSAEYCPRYFDGFLQQFPDAPASILAPYQFNFPGTIAWTWTGDFWDWYFVEKNKREIINFLDKDPDRVWKFRGSLDPCDDIVAKLKEILK